MFIFTCLSDVDMWQSTSLSNGQRSIVKSGTNIALFYKIKDPVCELNYRETKCKIGTNVGDQKYYFAKYFLFVIFLQVNLM